MLLLLQDNYSCNRKKPPGIIEKKSHYVGMERAVTPINDSITIAPKTFEALSTHIRRRIQPRTYYKHLKESEQGNMVGWIIHGCLFKEMLRGFGGLPVFLIIS